MKLVTGTVDFLMKGQSISNYNINLNISPEKGVINVECDINVKFLKDRRYIIFLLNDGLKVNSIKYRKAIRRYRLWLINLLLLPEKIKKGEDINFSLVYEGNLRQLGFSDGYIKEKEFILRNEDLWYPMDFQGLFTLNVNGTVPVSITPALPGSIINKLTGDGKGKRFSWRPERPVTGFALMGGYFNKLSKSVNGTTYTLYSPVYHNEDLEKTIDNIILCHSFFKSQFGDDGFKNLTVIITPHGYRSYNHGAGIITLSKTDFSTIAHEIAHNWWGGTVYVDLLKRKGDGGQWIAEGFAEFSSLMTVEKLHGKDAFLRELKNENFNPDKQRVIESITTFDNLMNGEDVKINNQMVYAKGAYVLIMLREIMGEEKFMKAIKNFFSEYNYKIVNSSDFQGTVERIMGNSFSWFFDPWIRGTERLDFEIKDFNSMERGGTFVTTVKVVNKGKINIFTDIDIMAITENGKEIQRVFIDENPATVVFNTKSKIKEIIADPFLKWADMERENNIVKI
ncbi:MAG: hypothetical protein HY096_03085 [Nitrospinae bacterium]|nr:hypothetical protein [Nitrospinota bacterium]